MSAASTCMRSGRCCRHPRTQRAVALNLALAAGALVAVCGWPQAPAWVGSQVWRSEARKPQRTSLGATASKAIEKARKILESDPHGAVRLIKEAAELGDHEAMTIMGTYLAEGSMGLQRDCEQAREWLEKAAGLGNVDATTNLAMLYIHGICVPQNKKTGAMYLKQAAELGNQDAMEKLAMMLITGDGVMKDIQLGATWITRAAQSGGYADELQEKMQTNTLDPKEKAQLDDYMEKLRDINRDNPHLNPQDNKPKNDDSPASGW